MKPGERRELWRRDNDSVYLNHLGDIGISCDGRVIEMDARNWHQLVTWQHEWFDRQRKLYGMRRVTINGEITDDYE